MKQTLQPIIDRFAAGVVQTFHIAHSGWMVTTDRGTFYLLEGSPELDGIDFADTTAGATGSHWTPVQLADDLKQGDEDAFYVEHQDVTYSLYRLDEPS
ncbi:hypothetical protein ACIBCP_27140 [Streptomyces sp. NPDC051287]|uniref:hypothetical protein n=1 Tax=Streptomyces sp. NPDC051287 TaxID=3365648 RepID=UPI0037999404